MRDGRAQLGAAAHSACSSPQFLGRSTLTRGCSRLLQVKEFLLEANWTTATSAKKYTAWTRRQVRLGQGSWHG